MPIHTYTYTHTQPPQQQQQQQQQVQQQRQAPQMERKDSFNFGSGNENKRAVVNVQGRAGGYGSARKRWGDGTGVKDSVDEFESLLSEIDTSHASATKKVAVQRTDPLDSFSSVRKDSGVAKKTPPSAKQHYMKQARYFPGQTTSNQPRMLHNPAASTYSRKPSYGMAGNAVGGTTYVPSFAGGGQTRAGGVGVFSASTWKPPPLTKQGSGTSIYQPPGATATNRTQPARYGGVHNRTNWSVKYGGGHT